MPDRSSNSGRSINTQGTRFDGQPVNHRVTPVATGSEAERFTPIAANMGSHFKTPAPVRTPKPAPSVWNRLVGLVKRAAPAATPGKPHRPD